jgi:hypothetical protein
MDESHVLCVILEIQGNLFTEHFLIQESGGTLASLLHHLTLEISCVAIVNTIFS